MSRSATTFPVPVISFRKDRSKTEVGRLERALKERNGIETERRRAESKLKVLETQRDVDIQTLQDHQEEIRGLKLQLSARVEQENLVQSAHTKPNKESSTGVAVWQKARVFEERIGKSEAKQATKTNLEDPKPTRRSFPVWFIRQECRASPRSPNSQMREKLAKARSRIERLAEAVTGAFQICTPAHLRAPPEAKDAEPETEPKPEAECQGGAQF
ncbi:CKMT2 [Symbiodinium sp. CCMP2456]|nr:CKMT2 [Symbiodinium sp. CCMP2456]